MGQGDHDYARLGGSVYSQVTYPVQRELMDTR